MVRLGLALALLAGPAAAQCFGPPLPSQVDLQDGSSLAILSHTARDLTYRGTLPDGTAYVSTLREGLFQIGRSQSGTAIRLDWIDPLPHLAELTPGDHGSLRADLVVEQAHTSYFSTDYNVLRAETLTVQGCDYPVLVIERTDRLDGRVQSRLTLWLSPALRLPLRTDATEADLTTSLRVIALR